jgi:hypothetical protein
MAHFRKKKTLPKEKDTTERKRHYLLVRSIQPWQQPQLDGRTCLFVSEERASGNSFRKRTARHTLKEEGDREKEKEESTSWDRNCTVL